MNVTGLYLEDPGGVVVVCEFEENKKLTSALEQKIRDGFIHGHMIADKLSTLLISEEFCGRTEHLKYALRLIRNLSLGTLIVLHFF